MRSKGGGFEPARFPSLVTGRDAPVHGVWKGQQALLVATWRSQSSCDLASCGEAPGYGFGSSERVTTQQLNQQRERMSQAYPPMRVDRALRPHFVK